MKKKLFKYSSPQKFYLLIHKIDNPLLIISLIITSIAICWGLFYAPTDKTQGEVYRIIYIHVPSAFIAQTAFLSMSILALSYLTLKIKLAAYIIKAIAPIGACFSLITLITGSIWGKPTWGTWWVWDARLTSMLILLILYIGVILTFNSYSYRVKNFSAPAIVCLIGAVNLPIIKFSVNWWNTLHQPASITFSSNSIENAIFFPLLLNIIGLYCLYIGLIIANIKNTILYEEQDKKWVKRVINHDC